MKKTNNANLLAILINAPKSFQLSEIISLLITATTTMLVTLRYNFSWQYGVIGFIFGAIISVLIFEILRRYVKNDFNILGIIVLLMISYALALLYPQTARIIQYYNILLDDKKYFEYKESESLLITTVNSEALPGKFLSVSIIG